MVKRRASTLTLLLGAALACWEAVWLLGSETALPKNTGETSAEAVGITNHVLLLPGNGGFAELPIAPFRGLTNATIECWVRWDELAGDRQAFNFGNALRGMRGTRRVFNYGSPWRDVSILSFDGAGLGLVVADGERNLNWLRVPDVLMGGEWCHIAAVIGNGEMQLYLNGFPLRPPQKCTGSFATADSNGRCYLGKSVTESDSEPTMAGAIDEFRVWDHLRGADAIRGDMFRRVQEGEPGLVWFSDFEPEPEGTDGTLAGVKLAGGTRLVVENLPKREELREAPPRFGPRMAAGGPGGPSGFGGSGWRGRSPPLGFLTGLLSAFCVMHALLFAFQPAARNHLYFALISGLAAGMTWPGSERSGIGIHWLALLAVLTLRLFQSLFEPETSEIRENGGESAEESGRNLYKHFVGLGHRRFRTMVLGALIVCAIGVINKNVMSLGLAMEVARLVALFILIRAALLILRIAWGSWRQKREGARLIGLGLGALLVLAEIPAPIPRVGGLTFGQLGVVIFFCAMSVHLAKTFAMANRRLALQAAELNESNARLRQANEAIEQQKRDLAEAKAAAEAANEAKSRFLASVSHELRTPLNAIIGYSEMLQEIATEEGNHQYLSDLQKIHAAAHHQLTLINDILDLSKVEAGKMTVLAEEFDVAELVNDVVSTVQPLVAKGEAILSVHCGEGVGRMCSDPTKVRQILFNLLSNAAKFTPRGRIEVRVARLSAGSPETGAVPSDVLEQAEKTLSSPAEHNGAPGKGVGDQVVFVVSDTGIGMTPEQVKCLFQPFAQVDVAAARKHGGTGLGLALVKRFCDLLGGEVSVETAPSKGSTFTVKLPAQLKPCREEPPSAVTPKPPLLVQGQGKSGEVAPLVLVIDDDASARDLLERALRREGFDVVTASNGLDGVRLLERIRPAVITLDVIMPPPDGWALLTLLKSNPATADIPVVMATVVDQQNIAFALGADEYLIKPIDRERLSKVMARFRGATKKRRVLIVEDDAATRDWLKRALERDGWESVEAVNGRHAAELVKTTSPDLILLDLLMPEMDGFEFLDVIRRDVGQTRVPVIVLTAKELTEEDRKRLNGCVNRILAKGGLSPTELIREIRAVLQAVLSRA